MEKVKEKTEIEKAQEIIDAEKQQRAEQFNSEMKVLTEKYKVELVVKGQFIGNQLQTQIMINAL